MAVILTLELNTPVCLTEELEVYVSSSELLAYGECNLIYLILDWSETDVRVNTCPPAMIYSLPSWLVDTFITDDPECTSTSPFSDIGSLPFIVQMRNDLWVKSAKIVYLPVIALKV